MSDSLPIGRLPISDQVSSIEMSLHDLPGGSVRVEVFVDSVPTTLGPPWDALALIASARAPGRYFIGNCDCGEPRCAGVLNPVQVRHIGSHTTWTVPQPYDTGIKIARGKGDLTVVFDSQQYRTAADALLQALHGLRSTVTLCCYPTDTMNKVLVWAAQGYAGHGGFKPLLDDETAT